MKVGMELEVFTADLKIQRGTMRVVSIDPSTNTIEVYGPPQGMIPGDIVRMKEWEGLDRRSA